MIRVLLAYGEYPPLVVAEVDDEGKDRQALRRAVARALVDLADRIDRDGLPDDLSRPPAGRGKTLS